MKQELKQISEDRSDEFLQEFLNNEVTNFYVVQKVLREKIDEHYPYFRYAIIKEEIMKDPEFNPKKQSQVSKQNNFR